MKFIIQKKNGQKLSSIYLNDLGYNNKYIGINNEEADYLGFIQKPNINKLFVFRKNSAITFNSIEEINSIIEDSINDIKKDNRYNEKIKKSLINSTNNLKNNIKEIGENENYFI